MQSEKCAELAKLEEGVRSVLQQLIELTAAQLQAFRTHDQPEFLRLDKELENMIGVKERRIGALRQHGQEHGCRS